MNLQRQISKTASRKNSVCRAFASGKNRLESRAGAGVWARRRRGIASGQTIYAYVGGDPVARTDPLGLKSRDCYIDLYIRLANGDPEEAAVKALNDRNNRYPNDLDLRDAEHYLFAYAQVRKNPAWLIPLFYATPLYTGSKAVGQPFGFFPEASPPSVKELVSGFNGMFDGMDDNFGSPGGRGRSRASSCSGD